MDQSLKNVPIVQCVVAAWGFFTRNLSTVYRLGIPYILASGIGIAIVLFAPANSPISALGPLFIFMSWFLYIAMDAALFRLALGQPAVGFGGLTLGADEFRLFVTNLLIGLIAFIVVIVAAVIVFLAISTILLIGVDPELAKENPNLVFEQAGVKFWILQGLGVLIIGVILLYLYARFSPAFPAAIGEQAIRIFEAAAWTKGQGWRISLVLITSVLPIYVIMAPSLFVVAEQMMVIMRIAIADPQATPSAEMYHIDFHWRLLPILLTPALSSIRAGLFSTLYRGLRPA
ncbi:MAG: hypothetical protein JKX99_10785 [Robiginitomaculum sp.]|nr:hypothetical protein [Robiginitomaculum sp.]